MEKNFLIFFVTVAFACLAYGLPTWQEDEIYIDEDVPSSVETAKRRCSCEKDHHACGCCLQISVHGFYKNIQAKVCMNATYVPSASAADFFMIWNNHVLFNKSITAAHPPPICFDIPKVEAAKGCVKFSRVSLEKHHTGACVALELKAQSFSKDIPLGCFFFKGRDVRTFLDKESLNLLMGDFFPSYTGTVIPRNYKPEYSASDLKTTHGSGCDCGKSPPHCDCCARAQVFKFPVNACVHADVDKTETGFTLAISINSFEIVKTHISVADPPPVCHKFSRFLRKVKLCLKLTNVSLERGHTGGCLELDINSSKWSLGCFYMKRMVTGK